MRKIKKRYVIIQTEKIDQKGLQNILVENIKKTFGIKGLSITRPAIIYSKENLYIVAIDAEGIDYFRASLVLLEQPRIKVIKITGTSRKAKRIVESYKR